MERKLIKGATYSLIIGLLLGILFLPDSINTYGNGMNATTSYEIPMRDYILDLLRFAIKMMFATIIVIWVMDMIKLRNNQVSTFLSDFTKSFVIVFAGIIVVFALISFITSLI